MILKMNGDLILMNFDNKGFRDCCQVAIQKQIGKLFEPGEVNKDFKDFLTAKNDAKGDYEFPTLPEVLLENVPQQTGFGDLLNVGNKGTHAVVISFVKDEIHSVE